MKYRNIYVVTGNCIIYENYKTSCNTEINEEKLIVIGEIRANSHFIQKQYCYYNYHSIE
jgi:hypothetical protein